MSIAGNEDFYGAKFLDPDKLIEAVEALIANARIEKDLGPPAVIAAGILEAATAETIKFDRVSTVLDMLGKGGALIGWAYKLGLEGVLDVAKRGVDLKQFEYEQLKAMLQGLGFTPWQKRDKAGDRGTFAHAILEKLATMHPAVDEVASVRWEVDNGDGARFNLEGKALQEARGYARGVLAWWEEVGQYGEMVASEKLLYSLEHKFCGTTDLIWQPNMIRNENDLVRITDLKTAKAVYESHPVQLSFYDIAWAEMTGRHADELSILLARPDGTYEEHLVDPVPGAALGLLEVHRALGKGVS